MSFRRCKDTQFQSTRPWGRDQLQSALNYAIYKFQSTRPWGARRSLGSSCDTSRSFQSTRPWGARHMAKVGRPAGDGFNPRARGGRDCTSVPSPFTSLFQSTRPWGARPLSLALLPRMPSFNPRARGGRDAPCGWQSSMPCSCFNPRARGGRDVKKLQSYEQRILVSIHAPVGGATPLTSIHPTRY